MKIKIFNSAFAIVIALVGISITGFAQVSGVGVQTDTAIIVQPQITTNVSVDAEPLAITTHVNTRELKVQMHHLKKQLKNVSITTSAQVTAALKNVSVELSADLAEIAPQIELGFKEAGLGNINISSDDSRSNDGNEQVKNYSKSYSVDANDMLSINNRYGAVTINTWAKNEFKVDVQIKVEANNDDDARKMLDNINISDSKDGSTIAFKTNIGSENSSWNWGRHSVHKMEINYTVYMPAKNGLMVDNSYGATILPDMAGRVTIKSAYGSFLAKNLSSVSDIKVKYGSAEIGSLGTSNLEVGYGSLNLGSADILKASISYSSANISKIRAEGDINLKYSGGLKIGDVDRNLKHLAINCSYSNVSLGLSGDENANFDVTTHYGDFDYGYHSVTITSKTPGDSDRGPHFTYNYKGYLGKGSTEKNITVSTSYGNVRFE